ncbi:ASIC5 [Bugula neritina]|uniref:ASIC5 n=1 Tax=Bugula neritina TaxID=10212 RepID=A0A7J7KQZ2_BUGNE|nr:ASIC5 [Bugula neritina]
MELLGNSELGLKFIVHTPTKPSDKCYGYSTGPGQKAFVGFNKNKVSNLHPPWGKCNPERKLTYADHYTVEACAIECKLSRVVAQCQCKPYYFPGDFDDCSYEQLGQCAFIEIAKINANFGEECDCPIACKNEEFDVKLSYASFPNIPYGGDLGKKFKITLPEVQPGVPEYGTQVQYIRGNVVSLDLYYESMSETETVQNKAMDSTALLGSIGGHLGLFIGCSVLTAVEFLECIIMSTLGHCKTAKRRRELSLKKTHEPELEENNHSYHNKAHFNENGNGSSDV